MRTGSFLCEAAALIGDPARANMLGLLMDGRARTATELAHTAGVAPSTASGHLAKLLDTHLVAVTCQGRHRYYRIETPAVATALESLMLLASENPDNQASISRTPKPLRRARSCYDHLAGELGVQLADAFVRRDILAKHADAFTVTPTGGRWFAALGIDLEPLKTTKRPFARCCLDWSERRAHIAGSLGAALLTSLMQHDYLVRERDSRAMKETKKGQRFFAELCEG